MRTVGIAAGFGLGVLAWLMVLGCSPEPKTGAPKASTSPRDMIAAFPCRPGMTAREVIDALGNPDSFQPPSWIDGEAWWKKYIEGDATLTEKDVNPRYVPPADGDANWWERDPIVFDGMPNGVVLCYGPFAVYHQQAGAVSQYGLTLEFKHGKLVTWRRSEPRQLPARQATP